MGFLIIFSWVFDCGLILCGLTKLTFGFFLVLVWALHCGLEFNGVVGYLEFCCVLVLLVHLC